METSEELKTALRQEAEGGVLKLLAHLQDLKQGDLKGVEQQVMETIFGIGRGWMERILSEAEPAEREAGERVGSCGHPQRVVGHRPKQVLTLLGKVTFRRAYYQCVLSEGRAASDGQAGGDAEPASSQSAGCGHGEAPADALWGVQDRRSSAAVQQMVSYLCASLTLEEAAEAFSRLVPLGMSARQALNLMQPVGEALGRQEDEQVSVLWQEAAQARTSQAAELAAEQEAIDRLYIELDGVMARLRRGSVAMEAKEQQRAGDVYREVKVGAVFEATGGPERSGLAPGVFVDQAGKKHYVARRCQAEDFGKLLYALAQQQGLARAQQVVILGDGAPWIWRLVEHHFPGAVQIVDLWHARQHVWEVAHAVFGRGSPEGSAWAQATCSLLVQGHIEDLVAELAALPPLAPEPGETRSLPEKAMGYFIANAARMRYPAFRAQGMHVGSGIAEAACKTVVSTRAKRTGMRWTPEGLDAVLALRTAVLNENYDSFCKQQARLVA